MGRGRIDVLIEWRQITSEGAVRTRKYVIECKVRTAKVGLDRLIHTGTRRAHTWTGAGRNQGTW